VATELQRRMRKRENIKYKVQEVRDQLVHVIKNGKLDRTLFPIETREIESVIVGLEKIADEWVGVLPD